MCGCRGARRKRRLFFFFNDTATTEIYTLSLHDALPICPARALLARRQPGRPGPAAARGGRPALGRSGLAAVARLSHAPHRDRKSTRLNSSHANISYAVFCLKKKKLLLIHYSTYCLPTSS